ncbi:unnamed protein product [Prorocentrum cordatum]|uniref:Uncharacterized protein n=1 Tax=Prorocentrum cordatum TaxID=2364126 RepID=A0ABN9SF96_9DINO|nr:unnamed protein product [Polarella glacialis]
MASGDNSNSSVDLKIPVPKGETLKDFTRYKGAVQAAELGRESKAHEIQTYGNLSILLIAGYFMAVLVIYTVCWLFLLLLPESCQFTSLHRQRRKARIRLYKSFGGTGRYARASWGNLLDFGVTIVSLASCLMYVVETYMPFLSVDTSWVIAEVVVSAMLFAEYLLTLLLVNDPLNYIFSLFGLVNVVTTLPVFVNSWRARHSDAEPTSLRRSVGFRLPRRVSGASCLVAWVREVREPQRASSAARAARSLALAALGGVGWRWLALREWSKVRNLEMPACKESLQVKPMRMLLYARVKGETACSERPYAASQMVSNKPEVLACAGCLAFAGSLEQQVDLLCGGGAGGGPAEAGAKPAAWRLPWRPLPGAEDCGAEEREPMKCGCGETFCSEDCLERSGHRYACVAGIPDGALGEAHPLLRFKRHAVSTSALYLFVGRALAQSGYELERAQGQEDLLAPLAPLAAMVAEPWWDVAVPPQPPSRRDLKGDVPKPIDADMVELLTVSNPSLLLSREFTKMTGQLEATIDDGTIGGSDSTQRGTLLRIFVRSLVAEILKSTELPILDITKAGPGENCSMADKGDHSVVLTVASDLGWSNA